MLLLQRHDSSITKQLTSGIQNSECCIPQSFYGILNNCKRTTFRSLSSWFFPSVNCSGFVRQRLCWLALVLELYCETLVRWADCVLSRGAVLFTPAWDRTHNSESWRKATQFVHASYFPLHREEGKSTKRGKKWARESHKWETDPRPYLVWLFLILKVM